MSPARGRKSNPLKMPQMPQPPKPPPGLKGFPKGLKGFPGTKSPPPTGPADPETLTLLQEAINAPLLITATYVDEDRQTDEHVFFPVELGAKRREPRVWAYQTAGGTGVGWRCFVVGRLSNVTAQQADGLIPEENPGSAKCMDQERPPRR